jgi:hypothetical protein
MKVYTALEIMTEVAWQVGDTLKNMPRAESRWHVVDIALRIIESRIIGEQSEDIDEIIGAWLREHGEIEEVVS